MGISEEKFREQHEKYKNLILRQVYDMTKDYYLAQDICQETFLKLYSYRDRIEEEKAKGWMLVVSYNKTCDWLRRNKKYYEIVEKNSDVVVSSAENPLEYHAAEMDNQNRCLHILRAVREKNEDWYEMLILFDYFGMSKKEIAERTGFPVGTVDTYLRRCKKWLKARFQDVKEK